MACQFHNSPTLESLSCNDGEASRGVEVLCLLQTTKSVGYAVFVIHWKSGENMGPQRFGCIKSVAKQALEKLKVKLDMLNNGTSNRAGNIQNQNQPPLPAGKPTEHYPGEICSGQYSP